MRAFTLIETAVAIIIVGVGLVAAMSLYGACTNQANAAGNLTTATTLVQNVQEIMAGLPFDDPKLGNTVFGPQVGQTLATYNNINAFDGSVLNPPIDSRRNTIPTLSQYTQSISVMPIYAYQLNSNTNIAKPTITKTTYTGAVRITVTISFKLTPASAATTVYHASWIRVDDTTITTNQGVVP